MTTEPTIAVAMFTIADQDAAVSFYTQTLGWEVRSDVSWGEGDEAGRWVEVAPAGSTARLALNPPMNGEPGGGAVGLETPDLAAAKEKVQAAGLDILHEMPAGGPVPAMFAINDPDGNWIWIVQADA